MDNQQHTIIASIKYALNVYQVVADPASPRSCWITRRDLFDWIWASSTAHVESILDSDLRHLCSVYDIPRPYGATKPENRNKPDLPSTYVADMPVPLVHFDQEDRSGYYRVFTARCSPIFLDSARIAAPVSDDDGYQPTWSYQSRPVANGRTVSVASGPYGPPIPLTRGQLRRIARDLLGNPALEKVIALYGLTLPVFTLLLEREGIAQFKPVWTWWEIKSFGLASMIWHSDLKRLSQGQARKPVRLTPEIREELQAAYDAGIAERDQRRLAHAKATKAGQERSQKNLEDNFDAFLQLLAQGIPSREALDQLNFRGGRTSNYVRALFEERLPTNFHPYGRLICGQIKRGASLEDRDAALLFLVCREPNAEPFNWRGVPSTGYTPHGMTEEALISYAQWLSDAAACHEATIEMAAA